jgi:putative hemin transport protein
MGEIVGGTPEALRVARAEQPRTRDRDLAASLGVSEAELLAAHVGHGAVRVEAHPDRLIPRLEALGPVMALTRNESCVIEKTGVYRNYQGGGHAGLVVADEIDLRMFPAHWVHAFALERATAAGTQRSIQVFDRAGDAVHKVYLRDGSNLDAWEPLVAAIRHEDQRDTLEVAPRAPVEGPSGNPERAGELREAWSRMTDTHQFLSLVSRLKMNRLGAYRIAGEPLARRLGTGAVRGAFEAAAAGGVPIMIFVGNRGCIEIHSGPVHRIVDMGPWVNILDPGLDLHLRGDHVAEVWAVDKPTKRGPAVSIECFDAEGALISQIFGVAKAGPEAVAAWQAIVADQPTLAADPVEAAE